MNDPTRIGWPLDPPEGITGVLMLVECPVLSLGKAMRRREFITLLGSAAAAWPLVARTETSHRIGLLFAMSLQTAKAFGLLDAINQGLKEYGWIDGQNIAYESRFADYRDDELPPVSVGTGGIARGLDFDR